MIVTIIILIYWKITTTYVKHANSQGEIRLLKNFTKFIVKKLDYPVYVVRCNESFATEIR